MSTKAELKALSDSTFTTNGVRAIEAVDHRAFNDDLIASLDTVVFNGIEKQIKKVYVARKLSLYGAWAKPNYIGLGCADLMPMTSIKDQLLTNVIEVRMIYRTVSSSNLSPSVDMYDINWVPLIPALTITSPTDLACRVPGTSRALVDTWILLEITYIPED